MAGRLDGDEDADRVDGESEDEVVGFGEAKG